MVQERTQAINDWLESHSEDIRAGCIKVYAVDECHAKGGDICGYGWGNRQQRREVEVDNYRDSQTYFGALDCVNEQVIMNIPAASGRGFPSLRSHTSWFDSVQQLPSDAVIRCAASGGESDPSEIEVAV